MSTALIRNESNIALADVMTLGDVFKTSGYFKDVREQSQAVVKILYGQELGFSPVVSMMGIHIIEGKPALSANLMGAMVKRSGKYNYQVKALTDTECVLTFTENGQPSGESKFSMADAQKAGVVRPGGSWTKYPRNMLFSRALSNGVKLYCPELSACPIYVPEELGAEVNEEGNVTSHPVTEPKRAAEVRTFGKPKQDSSANNGSGEVGKGTPPQTAEPPVMDAEIINPEATAEALKTASEEEFCTREQQDWLRLQFKDALPAKYHAHSDQLRRDWLKLQGFVKSDGVGSSTMIPRNVFKAEAKRAIAHAKGL